MKLNANDKTLIARCITTPAEYKIVPHGKGVKHSKFNMPPKFQARLHELALAGYLCEQSTGTVIGVPETTIIFTATALGREAVDHYRDVAPLKNFERSKSDAELLTESQER